MERTPFKSRPVWFSAGLSAAAGCCIGCMARTGRVTALFSALAALGQWLRELSLSGSNTLAWAIVLALSALPALGLLCRGRKQADWLLALAGVTILAWLFFLVNPTLLGTVFPAAEIWGMCGLTAVCSILVCWALLRLTGTLEQADTGRLASLLFWGGAVYALLLGAGATQSLLDELSAVAAGNTGDPGIVTSTRWYLTALTAAKLVPSLLAASLLMRGSRLVEALEADPFGEDTVALAERISRFCSRVVRLTLAVTVGCNLFQMVCFSRLASVDISVYLPVLTLALAAVLQQMCRYFRRAKAVSDDNNTII